MGESGGGVDGVCVFGVKKKYRKWWEFRLKAVQGRYCMWEQTTSLLCMLEIKSKEVRKQVNHSEFNKRWVEKALHVPVQKRKRWTSGYKDITISKTEACVLHP